MTDISIGGIAGIGFSGTDAVWASTCVACSGMQCFWHSGLAGVSRFCAQPSSMPGIEFTNAVAVAASNTVGQT
ncbi:MAG: hypothetical protein ABFC67_06340 [Mizugakiibacter sp.]|uniref:hypothetical protein n=1 Tax=Mizugakiibacter sp. TaxID=1972610 RepID=UPI0031C0ABAE|nr:hypothetical protein [Xanthomonadaceae bacterium]